MTEQDIQFALGRHFFLKKICIPNVSMYCVGKTEYEADFIYFDLKTRYITEVEIKTSIQDFKRDFKRNAITTVEMLSICIMQCLEVCITIILMILINY